MSAADIFGLVVSLAVFVYLVYALFRGEKLLVTVRASARSSSTSVVLIALAIRSGSAWRASTRRCAPAAARSLGGRARLPPPARRRRRASEQDWKSYASTVLVFSVALRRICSMRSSGCRATSS